MHKSAKSAPVFSHELGGTFTWVNPDSPSQKGWELDGELRKKIYEGDIKCFVLAVDAKVIEYNGVLGGIEVILNSEYTGFSIDYKSFPWHWDAETFAGGWISYEDLVNEKFSLLNGGVIYLKYNLTSHPSYKKFRTAMKAAEWAQVSIQYGLGTYNLPFVKAYLHETM
jgi:hypothetical protein